MCWGGQVCHGEFLVLQGQALQMDQPVKIGRVL